MDKYFPCVTRKIEYEGPDSKNPLAFKYYNPSQQVNGKTMEQHLRFSAAYWHTLKGSGDDMFGEGTFNRQWQKADSSLANAELALDAAFEFFLKLGVPFYCFHDRDLAPVGNTFSESCKNLEYMVEKAKKKQQETGIKLLWGTANLFSHARYAHGAATNPDVHVFAYAAAQVKHAIAATHELGGENYVFWGGREGYETLLNTDMKKEQENLASFFHMAVDYAKSIGFTGQFLIEPKPKEPTKHQYDFDVSSVLNFLRTYDLLDHFKLNVEANHATLAGHTFEHDLAAASIAGKLGSVDANRGDLLLGWDTDQFPTDLNDTIKTMLVILHQGGLGSGGLNFDAKLRRGSTDLNDLFYAHIGGMDTFARGLLIAQKMIDDRVFSNFIEQRYASYNCEIGKKIASNLTNFNDLENYVLDKGEPEPVSGSQEMLENIFNSYF